MSRYVLRCTLYKPDGTTDIGYDGGDETTVMEGQWYVAEAGDYYIAVWDNSDDDWDYAQP